MKHNGREQRGLAWHGVTHRGAMANKTSRGHRERSEGGRAVIRDRRRYEDCMGE